MQAQQLYKWATILLIAILTVIILVYAKSFLVPLAFAGLLAMLLLPVTKWLQRKRFNKVVAILAAILMLVAGFAGIIYLISWQVSDLASDLNDVEGKLSGYLQQARTFIADKFGISKEQQKEIMEKQQSSSAGQSAAMISGVLGGIAGFLTDALLVLVYIFLFLFFRDRLKGFVLRLVKTNEKTNVESIFSKAQHVTQKYLSGLAIMIVVLWIMYGIGFSIVGVKHAIFFGILCGLLEIVPFVGNLAGTALTIIMSIVQGGDLYMILGILVTYALVQFIQTYLLEPLVVGAEVNINPLFTIVGLVAGEAIWGIPGMILAIPLMGIAKILCDHVDSLKPFAYLIGQPNEAGGNQKVKSIGSKLAKMFK